MEQLRAPFHKKNASTLYYTLSIILRDCGLFIWFCADVQNDLPNHRLGRPTDQSTWPWRMSCPGSSFPNSAKYESFLAKQLWPSIPRRIDRTMILLGWQRTV